MNSNYLAVVVNTFFKFLFCHIAKLLKIGQISKKSPTDCSVRPEAAAVVFSRRRGG